MARPKFTVQHFIACLNAAWEGIPGSNTARTLEGVIHKFSVIPGSEPSFEFDDLWLYARFFHRNQVEGIRRFSVKIVWLDAPGGGRDVFSRSLSTVRFTNGDPIVNIAWSLRSITFPGVGRYEFRLRTRNRSWSGSVNRIVAREIIRIEQLP
jgi:hypothetical protein